MGDKTKKITAKTVIGTTLLTLLFALVFFALGLVFSLFVTTEHVDVSTGLKFRITSWNTCKIASVGNCTDTEIEIPENILFFTVTEIGGAAFSDVDGLKKVVIPETVTKVEGAAFRDSADLEEVVLPSGLTEISDEMFSGCKSLENIDIPETVTVIGRSAFSGTSIAEINIGKNIKEIQDYAFSNCDLLTEVEIPDTLEVLGGAFSGCDNLKSIIVGEGIKEIPSGLLTLTENLETIVFPGSIEYISNDAIHKYGPFSCEITYLGTLEEWCEIPKGENWCVNIVIRCTDGAILNHGNVITE
jgi:hypothetical protein